MIRGRYRDDFRNLHEQCDKTLSEAQSRIRQLENELSQATSRVSSVDRFKGEQERLVSDLREDISVLKKNLVQLEREKDDFLVNIWCFFYNSGKCIIVF